MASCYAKCQGCLHGTFYKWGAFVAKYPFVVLIGGIIILGAFGAGMSMSEEFDDPNLVWAPAGSQAVEDFKRSGELFKSSARIS